jgi:hypothetical protein
MCDSCRRGWFAWEADQEEALRIQAMYISPEQEEAMLMLFDGAHAA